MYRIVFACFFFLPVFHAAGQTTSISGPAGSGAYGTTITILENGNYVVTDPLYDDGSLTDVGAVYLYNGSTHVQISLLKGSTVNDSIGSNGIVAVGNSNFVVRSPRWDNGSTVNAGAITWCNGTTGLNGIVGTSNSLVGGNANEQLGSSGITVLTNGNYVVPDLFWKNGTNQNAGSVTWANGNSGVSGLINSSNSLVGSSAFDQVGSDIVTLANGNFLVVSSSWNNGGKGYAGAVTWVNGTSGLRGAVSAGNSLVGGHPYDYVGRGGIILLSNGNYVVCSPDWDFDAVIMDAGAVTLGNGTSGITGLVNVGNSLVGDKINYRVGTSVVALTNGNYVVRTINWAGAASRVGAVTWGNGTSGTTGIVTTSNSLVGSTALDYAGSGGITVLNNGNYVISSPDWDHNGTANAGAVTWVDGSTGASGEISSANSLVGSNINDHVGSGGSIALTNGNYVVVSYNWANGTNVSAGAVTWANGSTGITGTVSSLNSLVGGSLNDQVGSYGVMPLPNGNFVVLSPNWNNGSASLAGAVTWGNGATGLTGIVSSNNSLVGSSYNDQAGRNGITILANSNYVVSSWNWDNGPVTDAGAVTWANGSTGTSGIITSLNSLVGSSANDQAGSVVALTNGNYVVITSYWDNGSLADAGAVTWGSGVAGVSGIITSSNSLVGSQLNDQAGFGNTVSVLTNGNYVVSSPYWDNGDIINAGAVTWGNGNGGTTGNLNAGNSLIGTTSNDGVGYGVGYTIASLTNGNYVVRNMNWDNGALADAGAVTWGNGAVGVRGPVTSCNSVLGAANSGGEALNFVYNHTYNYLAVGLPAENRISLYNPSGMQLAGSQDNCTLNIHGTTETPLIANSGCRIIATLKPNGPQPVSGLVTARIWVESSVPARDNGPFVARHYEITPESNAATATAQITLYFTQSEFDEFNAHAFSVLDLPTGETDDAGKSHLRIGKYPGTSSNGTGLPGSYASAPEIINPDDDDIVWNSNLARWEVSVDVTGFSGFIVQTSETALPLTLLEIHGVLENNNGIIKWKTTGEYNTQSFDIQRSIDGQNFFTVGNVPAMNLPGTHDYVFTDPNINLLGAPVLFYRLRLNDMDGQFTYSRTVLIPVGRTNTIQLYPNPVLRKASLAIWLQEEMELHARILDNTGRVVRDYQWQAESGYQVFPVDVRNLSKGIYYLELNGTSIRETIRFVKE